MKITYYGHFCFGAEIGDYKLLFDPFIRYNPLAKHIEVEAIKADYVLVSHGHQDHVADAVEIIKANDAELITSVEVASWFNNQGIANARGMNFGGRVNLPFGQVKFVTAIHSSSLPDGSYGANPGGFVITTDEQTFYFAGDTALTYDMKLIGEYHRPDFAMLPIGDFFTMGFEDAAIAADFIQCDRIIGAHYNTFPPIEIDTAAAKNHFSAAGKELLLFDIGETRTM